MKELTIKYDEITDTVTIHYDDADEELAVKILSLLSPEGYAWRINPRTVPLRLPKLQF